MEISNVLTTGLIGFATGILVPLLAYIAQRKKSSIDESTLVLGKWKELVDQHQESIKDIRAEFADYKRTALAEIEALRDRLAKAEKRIIEGHQRIFAPLVRG